MLNIVPAAENIRVFPDGRLTVQDASLYTGVTQKSLAAMRTRGEGPAFVRLGKLIFYKIGDLDQWMETCRARSTTEWRTRNRAGLCG